MILRNVGILLHHDTASQLIRPRPKSSQVKKLQNSHIITSLSLDNSVVQCWTTGWTTVGSSLGRSWEFFSSSYAMGTRGSFAGGKAAGA
jgi:hypothetical protein